MRLGWGVLEVEAADALLVVLNEARAAPEEEAGTAAEAAAKRGNTVRPEREGIIVRAWCFRGVDTMIVLCVASLFFPRCVRPPLVRSKLHFFDGQTESHSQNPKILSHNSLAGACFVSALL